MYPNSRKMILAFLVLTTLSISTAVQVSFDSERQSTREPDYWGFQKFILPNKRVTNNYKTNCLEMMNLELGPFGASKLALGVKPSVSISSFKKTLRYYSYYGYYVNSDYPDIKDETFGNDEHVITFGLNYPHDGEQNIYICFQENFALSDIKSVQFYTANPTPNQFYYFLVQQSGKALALYNNPQGGNLSTNYLRHFSNQKFKFERVCHGECVPSNTPNGINEDDANREYRNWDGGYKIVTYKDDEELVLAVKDSRRDNDVLVMAETFTGAPNQVWYIQEYQAGFRFRPKLVNSKCLDLIGYEMQEGARVVIFTCSGNVDLSMIWVVIKASC